MEDKTIISLKGHVKAYINGQLVLDKHNDIQTSAKEIIRRALGSSSHKINKVIVLDSGTELAHTLIAPSQVMYPSTPGVVSFTAVFSEVSFSGDFNEIHLTSNSNLLGEEIFSILSFDPITKTSDNSLVIDWVITIELL